MDICEVFFVCATTIQSKIHFSQTLIMPSNVSRARTNRSLFAMPSWTKYFPNASTHARSVSLELSVPLFAPISGPCKPFAVAATNST